jgi:hypothetical protein
MDGHSKMGEGVGIHLAKTLSPLYGIDGHR